MATINTYYLISGLINAAGSGYKSGDIVSIPGATGDMGARASIAITSVGGAGEVLQVALLTAGQYTENIGGDNKAAEGGSGTGLTLNLTTFASEEVPEAPRLHIWDLPLVMGALQDSHRFPVDDEVSTHGASMFALVTYLLSKGLASVDWSNVSTINRQTVMNWLAAQSLSASTYVVMQVNLADAGQDYKIGDELTIPGVGTKSTFRVGSVGAAGDIRRIYAITAGSYTADPALNNPLTPTGGSGTGCKVNIITKITSGAGTNNEGLLRKNLSNITDQAILDIVTFVINSGRVMEYDFGNLDKVDYDNLMEWLAGTKIPPNQLSPNGKFIKRDWSNANEQDIKDAKSAFFSTTDLGNVSGSVSGLVAGKIYKMTLIGDVNLSLPTPYKNGTELNQVLIQVSNPNGFRINDYGTTRYFGTASTVRPEVQPWRNFNILYEFIPQQSVWSVGLLRKGA